MKAYADAQGLDVQEFYNQKSELRRKGLLDAAFEAESRFARLTVEPDALPERRCRMELPNGVTLDLLEPDSAPGLATAVASGVVVIMMRPANDLPDVYLCREPVDFRKGIAGLAALVEAELGLDPLSSRLFVFTNRRRTGVKILYWERNGFCLWQKRLEQERFHWLRRTDGVVGRISGQQLNWLLDGYDITRITPHKTLEYTCVS
ncbi:putative IS66 Orf2 family protein [Magnetofaba australis IT-1]|uniref:Putative IS66 Orf2 family protein n=1 Tax=Magnetofaba australis IT-1 TaxID=1434232 RepID=A0A1Y2K7T0_9PROT|nr:putative IS66 Orf2 family protein [Magnetofaba australis IT-1]